VYNPVTHFIPWEFPLLVIVPAAITDLVLQRTSTWRPWLRGLTIGGAFLATFLAVQWPFATFLMTPAARNWFFGTTYRDYGTPANSLYARFEFLPPEPALTMMSGLLTAALVSWLMAYLGLYVGRAMHQVRR
jgi:hypothetical protein